MSKRSVLDFFVGVVGIGIILIFLAMLWGGAEHWLLSGVSPPSNINSEDWERDFDLVQWNFVFLPASGLALAWVLFTSLFDAGISSDRRSWWVVLGLGSAGFSLYGMLTRIPATSGGHFIASSVMLLNTVLAFWPMTVITSPQTHKYAPLMSNWLRRGW